MQPRQPKPEPQSTGEQLGEGNRTAAKRYNEGVQRTVESGDVDALADEAKKALEGSEGPELRAAEKKAKRGAPAPAGKKR